MIQNRSREIEETGYTDVFLDTSVIIEIFRREKKSKSFQRILDTIGGNNNVEEPNYMSIVQLAEISDWCSKNGIPSSNGINSAKSLAQILPLDESVCQKSGGIKLAKRKAGDPDFGLIDAIILASARSIGQKLLTLDGHFEGENDCAVLN